MAVLLLFSVSCTRPQVKLQQEITAAEQKIRPDSIPFLKPAEVDELVTLYEQYAGEFPDDTLSADYLFRAGQLCVSSGRYEMAITIYGKVLRYMNYRNVAAAQFMQGFVADNHLRDTTRARMYYEKFLLRYPQNPLSNDVRLLLEQMSSSPEQLIQLFEKRAGSEGSR